jgi:hypothetical protein
MTDTSENLQGGAARADSSPKDGGGEIVRRLKSWDVVAYLGLLVYVTTLASEYGRAAYWSFPAELVQFTPENALATFVRLIAFGLLVGFAVQTGRAWRWYQIFIVLVCSAAAVLGVARIGQFWGGLGLMLALAGFGYSVWGITAFLKPDESPGAARLNLLLGREGIALSVVLIVVPFASLALGYFAASVQQDFVIATAEPRRVVLAAYGSQAVCATLNVDQTGKWIAKSFSVVDLSGEHAGDVVTEHVGRVDVRDR